MSKPNCELCQIECFVERKCVSYNCRGISCELNSADHIKHPEDLVDEKGSDYHAAEVSRLVAMFCEDPEKIIFKRRNEIFWRVEDRTKENWWSLLAYGKPFASGHRTGAGLLKICHQDAKTWDWKAIKTWVTAVYSWIRAIDIDGQLKEPKLSFRPLKLGSSLYILLKVSIYL